MVDKKLSSVSAVNDMNYVYAETSSGETVKISKADLASVVAGLMGNPLVYKATITDESALNNTIQAGYYGIQTSVTVNSVKETIYGNLLVQVSPKYVSQMALGSPGIAVIRRYDIGSGVWSDWYRLDNFGYNSLAGLSKAVGGVPYGGELKTVNDFNKATSQGLYQYTGGLSAELGTSNFGIVLVLPTEDYVAQIMIGNSRVSRVSFNGGASWTSWA